MGNKQCSCLSTDSSDDLKRSKKNRNLSLTKSNTAGYNSLNIEGNNSNASKLQHISDREQIDGKLITLLILECKKSLLSLQFMF